MAYLRRWHSSDPGVYTLAPFLLRVRETFERIANQPSVNGIACVRATGPFTAIPAARPFSSTSLSLSLRKLPRVGVVILSIPRHRVYTIIEMVTGIFGEAKLECRLSTKSSQRSRPTTTTRSEERKRERERHIHACTRWTRVFLHRAKWREAA